MLEILQTDEFIKWMKRLRNADAKARINVRIRRISLTGNFGDTKPVGDGVYELRIDYGPGYRVYYSQHRSEVVLLLIGGGQAPQQKELHKAQKHKAEKRL